MMDEFVKRIAAAILAGIIVVSLIVATVIVIVIEAVKGKPHK